MSGSLSKSLGLSSSFMKIVEQECPASSATGGGQGKQGIAVAILGSEDYCERNRAGAGASLRRTLSADMSSKTWLAQNGLVSPMKKIASSKELGSIPARRLDLFSSSEDEEEGQEYDQEVNKEKQNQGQYDIWNLIISQKAKEESKSVSAPYVHPLVKSRASSLSENSLKICTESLGSETGSDGFSSYPSSLTGDSSDLEKEGQEEEEKTQLAQSVSTTATVARKSVTPTRSFPPPLPSLSGDGAMKVRMQTRRDNGRLVVEAVSVPSQKNFFAAQRQDGRLVLTFAKGSSDDVTADHNSFDRDVETEVESEDWELNEEGEFEEQFGSFKDHETESLDKDDEDEDDDDDDEDNHHDDIDNVEEEKIYGVTEEYSNMVSTRLINVHRLASMMNKPVRLANRNPATTPWSKKLNEDNDQQDQNQKIPAQTTLAQSLPPRPRPTVGRLISSPPAMAKGAAAASIGGAAASFNAYEYFWRRSNATATATTGLKMNNSINNNILTSSTTVSSIKSQNPNDIHPRHEPQMLVLRGNKGEYLVSTLKGCKEPRRSLCWEPYCIATSS